MLWWDMGEIILLLGGGIVKIVFGSTEEQETTIDQLLVYLRYSILPSYMTEEELASYDSMGLLQFDNQRNLYNGTLKEAFQVMTALQTVISIIENEKKFEADAYITYEDKFNYNAELLNYFGLFFPFHLHYFKSTKCTKCTKSQYIHNNYSTQFFM